MAGRADNQGGGGRSGQFVPLIAAILVLGVLTGNLEGVTAAIVGLLVIVVIVLAVVALIRAVRARASSPAAEKEPGAPGEDAKPRARVEEMLLRSDNALETLRDLVAHGQGQTDHGSLPALLARTGLMTWESPPAMGAHRLRRNGRWWLKAADGLSKDDYDRLLGIEAALNLSEDIGGLPEDGTLEDALRTVLSQVAELTPRQDAGSEEQGWLLGDSREGGEWRLRMGLANFLENSPAPFRISFSMQANAEEGLVFLSLEVPRPAAFALVAPDDASLRAAQARAYALGSALLAARGAFESEGGAAARRVVVSCHEHEGRASLLSLDLTRESLGQLSRAARTLALEEGPLPDDPALRASVRQDGWLSPVRPFLRTRDRTLAPPARHREVELDDSPCDEAVARTCGARRVSDLGIMEKAGRAAAWNQLVHKLGSTTQDAVSRLMDLRGKADDLTVAEACERTSKALVDGTLDVSNRRELAKLFVDGSKLARTSQQARTVLRSRPTPQDLESALAALDETLSPITEMGIYLDDRDTVYRYFNSIAERVFYNLTADDQGRGVCLVPDEYYAAHSSAASILNMLNRPEEALAHVDELMRVAPATPDAALAKVRCLEEQTHIFEAEDLLKETVPRCSTARDMSVCLYRLAYMEWRLGRNDLAVACYQRSIELHPEMSEMARHELADLLASDRELSLLSEEQVVPTLEEAGIPAGDVERLRRQTRDALVACTDAGIFSVARPLASVLLELGRDDALLDVQRSLMRP